MLWCINWKLFFSSQLVLSWARLWQFRESGEKVGVIHLLWSQLLSQLRLNYQQDSDRILRENDEHVWDPFKIWSRRLSEGHTHLCVLTHILNDKTSSRGTDKHKIWPDVNPDYCVAPPEGFPRWTNSCLLRLHLLCSTLPSFCYICCGVMDDVEAGCSLRQTYQAPLATIFCPFAW